MGKARVRAAPVGITLDADALIASVRGDKGMIALLQEGLARDCTFRVPSGVVGQAGRNGRVPSTLARFLRAEEVGIVPLDEHLARSCRSCGEHCGATNNSDIIDASVVIVATERRDKIVSSDPVNLRHLDPGRADPACLDFPRPTSVNPKSGGWG